MPVFLARPRALAVRLLLTAAVLGAAVLGSAVLGAAAARAETPTPHDTAHDKAHAAAVHHPPHHQTAAAHAKPAAHKAPASTRHTPLVRAKPGPAAHPPATARAAPATPPPAAPIAPEEPTKGSNTGLPLPRFVSLKSDDVNMRSGPGTRYPIEWVYHRRGLPMEVEREFEVWRLVQDKDGVKGWVHQAVLVARRTAVVLAPEAGNGPGKASAAAGEQVMRSEPRADAAAVARLKPGVILRVRSCAAAADWCRVGIQDYRGWIRRSAIWGTLPGEAVQ